MARSKVYRATLVSNFCGYLSYSDVYNRVVAVFFNTLYSFWWDVTNDWGLAILLPSSWSIPSSPTLLSVQSPEPSLFEGENDDSPLRTRDARLHSRLKSSVSGRPSLISNDSRRPLLGSSELDNDDGFPPPSLHTRNRSASASASHKHPSAPHANLLRSPLYVADPFIYYLAIFFDLLLRFTWSLKLSSHLHSIHEIEQGVFLLEALEVIRRWMWVYIRVEWYVTLTSAR